MEHWNGFDKIPFANENNDSMNAPPRILQHLELLDILKTRYPWNIW